MNTLRSRRRFTYTSSRTGWLGLKLPGPHGRGDETLARTTLRRAETIGFQRDASKCHRLVVRTSGPGWRVFIYEPGSSLAFNETPHTWDKGAGEVVIAEGGCHINGEYYPVLVEENLARREINGLGCAKTDLVGQPNSYTHLM
ncbi:hypothetical protein [Microvirga yunnanensis]|uniref:hypothetical protein n=1 Tax=Microvirga yunnanensis TaxID=2953740 RepID=UPI0021C8B524|nr:hypothetical protein [Microvirga sp. HBU65207]